MKSAIVAEAVRSLRSELLDLAQSLVRCPSVTGEETAAQDLLDATWRDWGLEVARWTQEHRDMVGHPAFCDDGLPFGRPNLVARWGEGAPGEPAAIILNGHMDVVPAGVRARWDFDPFCGDVCDGALRGRGACDMKGGLAAASLAVRTVQKLGLTPKRPVLLQSVIGEETGGVGTLAAIERGYRADAAVIAEPTRLDLCPVQAGALSFRLAVPGRATHGATRENGVSAIDKLWSLWPSLQALEERRHRTFRHPLFDPARLAAPLSVGRLSAGNWPSSVPEEAVAEGRFGIFPGEECEPARRQFEAAVAEACRKDDWLRVSAATVEWFEGQFEPGETDAGSPILADLARAHQEVTGRQVRMRGVSYGSDLRLFTRYARMPAVLYGPGDFEWAHAANERVPVDDLLIATQVFAMLVIDVACRA